MSEVNTIKKMLSETVAKIRDSREVYLDFLNTSAWNFKYSLPDRLLIFAQRPDAIACAKVSLWEDKRFDRIVKKDSLGIAILDGDELQILYDVSDTIHLNGKSMPFAVWEYSDEYSKAVLDGLKILEPDVISDSVNLDEAIDALISYKIEAALKSYINDLYTIESILPENQESYFSKVYEYMQQTVSYMVCKRMGLSNEDPSFEPIGSLFSSEPSVIMALSVQQQASEGVLREIGYWVQKTHPAPLIEKTKKEDYYEHNQLPKGRPIFSATITDGRENGLRQVRTDEAGLSEEAQTGQIHVLSDGGDAEQSSGSGGHEGQGDGGPVRGEASEGVSDAGRSRHTDAGGAQEQSEADGRRTDVSGSDIYLEISPAGKERVRGDLFLAELRTGSGFVDGKFRIYEYFKEEHSPKDAAEFLKNEYGTGGHTSLLSGMRWVDHDAKGLTFALRDNDKKILYSWPEVARAIDDEIKKGTYLSEDEKEYLPLYENKLKVRRFVRKFSEYLREYPKDLPGTVSDLMDSFVGREILISHLTNYEGETPEEEDIRNDLIEDLRTLWSRETPKDPSWTKADWELYRAEEQAALSELSLKIDDKVYLQGKEFVVAEIDQDTYVLSDSEFPLFTTNHTAAELKDILKEDERNNIYFEKNEKITVGNSVGHRAYRLFSRAAADLLEGKEGSISFSHKAKGLSLDIKTYSLSEDNLVNFTISMNDEAISSFDAVLDNKSGKLIPTVYMFETSGDLLNAVLPSEIITSQLENFVYLILSEIEKDHFIEVKHEGHLPEPTEEKEAFKPYIEEDIEESPAHDNIEQIQAPDPINFKLNEHALPKSGPKVRYGWNIEAIKTLKKIEQENRLASPEEQKILSRYVGWGGLSSAFDARNGAWSKEYEELKSLLTEEEYAFARESTLTSFYTPPKVIAGVYKILDRLGFKEGNILEPSCGVGNFFGMLPEDMKESNLYGIELDSISGRIAKQLYQNATIVVNGFEKTNLPDQFFDVVLGNVPFGQYGVVDDAFKHENFLIHDYFFAKALSKVHPGGIIAFITSKGTLDKKDSRVREYIAKRADLLGAIRLPNDTFTDNAGTKVTSDILILKKRDRMLLDMPDWTKTSINEEGFELNNYFIDHPEMVLGKLSMETGQGGRVDLTCFPDKEADFDELFNEAILNIRGEYEAFEYDFEEEAAGKGLPVPADVNLANFEYTLIDDEVYQRRYSYMYPVETNAMALKRIKGLIPLRDTLRTLINVQLEDGSDEEVESYQKKLNELYDSFVKEFGYISSQGNNRAFCDDSSYYLLCSLEKFDDEENYIGKADIFTERTVRKKKAIAKVEDSMDALALSIGEKARVDLGYMSSLLENKSEDEIIEDLIGVIYRDPESGDYVTADEYLSGNVRKKLDVAREKAKEDSSFDINVEALLKVQPKDLDAVDISIRLGATWVPDDIITEFFWELFEVDERKRDPENRWGYTHITYSPVADSWSIENAAYGISHVLNTSSYGTKRREGVKIFEDALNLRESKVIDYYEEDGKRKSVVNKEETILAQEKQEVIKDEFAAWVWKDPERRERLTKLYNEKFNSNRNREYNGDYLLFHGMNPEITLRKHQLDAVARGIYGGNTLLDHAVGAGKTWEMVAIAMEGKRLGLSNKNLFVVPNHLLKQWAADFLRLYPTANILVATEKDFKPENRKKFCARIATGDFDAVIIGHSQFERIPMSDEWQEKYLQDQIDDISYEIDRVREENNEPLTVKQLERIKKSLEKNLDKFNDRVRRDDVITFEQLGVDRLFVDEFHFYKNLWFYTKMHNIAGLSATGAQKTSDLFMKIGYLNQLTGYKGLVGATGTPITNSIAEFYSLQRYFTPQVLDELGFSSFDAWASTFGEVVTSVELAPEGTNYRTKQRFAKFYNIPELISLYHDFADVKTANQLSLPVPETEFINVRAESSPDQKDMLKEFVKRADDVRNSKVDPTEDNMLKITTDGRKLALDSRLLDDTLSDFEGSKVNLCVKNLHEIWEKTKEDKLTQLVFCDLSTPSTKKKETDIDNESEEEKFNNVYEDIKTKLIARGIPADEIAFIHDAKTNKQKEKLFSNVRSGKVRILMGSTSKMGVGTNVQDKVIALHDLDPPWRPADLEQRLGRAERQGNQNSKITVFRYITEGTFDAYSYQLLEQKQSFIAQIRNGSMNVRAADDIDDSALMYSEIKALCAGNPLIKEKMDLDTQVHKLNLLRTEFMRNRYRLEDAVVKNYPKDIAACKIQIKNIEADIKDLEKTTLDDFSIILKGRKYSDEKEAGKALEEILKKNKNHNEQKIGSFAGFDILITYSAFEQSNKLKLSGNGSYTANAWANGVRNLNMMKDTLAALPEKLEKVKENLRETENDLKKAKEELTKEFAYEDELKEKNKRLTELNILLNVEGGAGKEELLKPAKDPNTPKELLSKLCEHDSVDVREAVAANPSISEEDLLQLKDDEEKEVRLSAYANPKMPNYAIFEFCKNADDEDISELLKKTSLNEMMLSILVDRVDSNSNFTYQLVKNKGMTGELLHMLAEKGDMYIKRNILERKDLLPETVELIASKMEGQLYISDRIAAHPLCSEERMLFYSRDREYGSFLHNALLRNPSVTDKVLEELARNGGYSVKMQAEAMLKERKAANNGLMNKTLDKRIDEIRDKLADAISQPEQEGKMIHFREY